jgi:hypothetical protein
MTQAEINQERWAQDTMGFIKEAFGPPKMPPNPVAIKNEMIADIIRYVSDTEELDRVLILRKLTDTLIK